jgi:hypothetical protein
MRVGGQNYVLATVPPERKYFTHYEGGCVGQRAGIDAYGISRSHRDSLPVVEECPSKSKPNNNKC